MPILQLIFTRGDFIRESYENTIDDLIKRQC